MGCGNSPTNFFLKKIKIKYSINVDLDGDVMRCFKLLDWILPKACMNGSNQYA